MKTLVVTSMLLAAGGWTSWLGLRERAEPVLFNPRERTERGLEALAEGETDAAARRFETAARLAPDDPSARFNAGTGLLAAGDAARAASELERAAETAEGALKARALYNLGNSRLLDDEPAAAVEAYKRSLRLDPTQDDARYNLEIALRKLADERSSRGEDQESPEGPESGEEEQSRQRGRDEAGDQPGPDDSAGRGEERGPERPDPESGEAPLPQFEEQPDMTAEQAAAILEAVDNLEREQRQAQAAELALQQAGGDRDW